MKLTERRLRALIRETIADTMDPTDRAQMDRRVASNSAARQGLKRAVDGAGEAFTQAAGLANRVGDKEITALVMKIQGSLSQLNGMLN